HQQRIHHQFVNFWLESLQENNDNVRDQLANEYSRRQQALERLQKQIDSKTRDVQILEANQVNYPGFVRVAIEQLNTHCPQADARVLCDYVEIIDPEWQSAIEGYIGAARFGIIVNQEYEAEAIRLIRSLPGQGKNARVIQGEKARRDSEKISALATNSIVQVMEFTHSTAEHY